jgi:hypothetical protein
VLRLRLFLLLALPSLARGDVLFFFDQSGPGACVAKEIAIPSKKEKVLFSLKECPGALFWDEGRKNVFYTEGGSLWTRPASNPSAAARELARLPRTDAELWIDAETGRPRVAWMVPVAEDAANEKQFRLDGRTFDSSRLVSFGTPFVAFSAELQEGKWVELEAVATKGEAGDTPALQELATFVGRKLKGTSLADLKMATICTGERLVCNPEPLDPRIKAEVGGKEGQYGLAKGEGPRKVYFAVIFGDTPHASAPVALCKDGCKSAIRLKEAIEQQLSVSLGKNHVVVATEYECGDPRVYDLRTGKLVLRLPKAVSAVWIAP